MMPERLWNGQPLGWALRFSRHLQKQWRIKERLRVYQLQEEELVSEICAVYNPHGYISLAAENLLKRMEEGSTAKAKRKRKMENE